MTDKVQFIDTFRSYCVRMWLDYCDENNDPLSAPNRLNLEDYIERYHEWLLERWQDRDLRNDTEG